jgi:hypothetical protein
VLIGDPLYFLWANVAIEIYCLLLYGSPVAVHEEAAISYSSLYNFIS